MSAIPTIDAGPLFGPETPARAAVDEAIRRTAAESGFLLLRGLPPEALPGPEGRARLFEIFRLPPAEKARLLRRFFDPAQPNIYRGWFSLQPGATSYKEGIDMGPDLAHRRPPGDPDDPLCEATPLPDEAALPGWRAAAAAYYRAMEATGAALMRSLARGLGLDEAVFDALFEDGISTLRLARYPGRDAASLAGRDPAELQVQVEGRTQWLVNVPHCDSGFATLLAQNGVPGLQARLPGGDWITVPPSEGTLVVNFGKLLERWTAGRIRATEHRVVALGGERFSIPFFYEPRVNAEIRPLPLSGVEPFAPFLYGDHVWAATTQFVEQKGIAHLRQPRGVAA